MYNGYGYGPCAHGETLLFMDMDMVPVTVFGAQALITMFLSRYRAERLCSDTYIVCNEDSTKAEDSEQRQQARSE